MFLLYTQRFVWWTPARVNTSRHRWTNSQIIPMTHELDAIVVFDLYDVRSITELAADTNQHDFTIVNSTRMLAEF